MGADVGRGDAPSYRAAGVDLARADRFKERLVALVEGTFGPDVVGRLGGFGGAFAIGALAEREPVLVATADGVGTKILVAQQAGRHDTIGQDLVHHCVDDLLAAFARPLFLLDYIATGRLDEDVLLSLVAGLARGCRENEITLLGGETAEMPDLYEPGEYDLAGFALGVAPRSRFDRPAVRPGDAVLGLASSGLHTNGYTLARRIVFDVAGFGLADTVPWGRESWADVLLAVHRSYLDEVGPLLYDPQLHAVAHVTGGGFAGNLPRVLPRGLGARLERDAWNVPPLFQWLREAGKVDPEEMYRVFNMGIGLCLVVDPDSAERIASDTAGIPLGHIVEGDGVVWA
jgi:phosphoribosylformylglycinamidine cyclo-ligase